MEIGIIGAGRIGGTLARRLTQAGHQVIVANHRGQEAMADLLADLGERGRAGSVEQAARARDLVVVATPLTAWGDLPPEAFDGRVVVDTANYFPQYVGRIGALEEGTTSSQMLAARLPGARLVKAFNTMLWTRLRDEGRPSGDPERLALPIASDDEQAKSVVSALIDELGFDAVDNGGLAEGGRRQQPGTPVYDQPLTAEEVRDRLGVTA
jgi:8-hydroxy-5-deazaflavin:NADPH oxidoreductase